MLINLLLFFYFPFNITDKSLKRVFCTIYCSRKWNAFRSKTIYTLYQR